jgi:beta-xylosidase
MRTRSILLLLALALLSASGAQRRSPWQADNGDGTFRNPILFADYSDPDVIRVGDDFYLISSSFECVPGIPVLHSKDLVNWRIIGHAMPRLPERYDQPRHGEGCWAPSLRYHEGKFWVYFGDPDLGVFMTTATDPAGPWEAPVLVKSARGWIDVCPLWDDDGAVYLVHAWARSRAGFNSVLTVNRLSADGRRVIDDGVDVFKEPERHPTIEGPKFYKRNAYYYIFAPAGGVKQGWQVVLRSRSVYGPYEDRIVMRQGNTNINGPHQGGWVETPGGESWFVHFQDRGAYGRITHLQPMIWRDDWPVTASANRCRLRANRTRPARRSSRRRPPTNSTRANSACSGSGRRTRRRPGTHSRRGPGPCVYSLFRRRTAVPTCGACPTCYCRSSQRRNSLQPFAWTAAACAPAIRPASSLWEPTTPT